MHTNGVLLVGLHHIEEQPPLNAAETPHAVAFLVLKFGTTIVETGGYLRRLLLDWSYIACILNLATMVGIAKLILHNDWFLGREICGSLGHAWRLETLGEGHRRDLFLFLFI